MKWKKKDVFKKMSKSLWYFWFSWWKIWKFGIDLPNRTTSVNFQTQYIKHNIKASTYMSLESIRYNMNSFDNIIKIKCFVLIWSTNSSVPTHWSFSQFLSFGWKIKRLPSFDVKCYRFVFLSLSETVEKFLMT